MTRTSLSATALLSFALASCDPSGGAEARRHVWAVGSSTVYPFAKAVAEKFSDHHAGFKSPLIEATGTGGGFKLFCAGVGAQHPDIANASRRIKRSEYSLCAKNGVKRMVELQIGLDGIAFAKSQKGVQFPLTEFDIYRALAASPFGTAQTTKTWKDVNPALPAEPIEVYGPPSTSGTRDALADLILTRGCDVDPAMRNLARTKPEQHRRLCTTIREDGAYVDSGENDNLIVQKIEANPKALGIFGYSFLEQNRDKVSASSINGVVPTYETIANQTYPGARPLFLYIKSAHLKVIPGLNDFIAEFASAWGDTGYLKKQGLVVSSSRIQAQAAASVSELKPLDSSTLP